ncbi:YncE family protein [Hydrogenophaga sp. BPS33]|uniref:YncE family protein n=1 Tax=Hydrogenophaga sp. BPS33 TaxID=2651974 RepID=UPI00131F7CC9|nr:YncE family protein [Hydrogenophaga sp. BPS33]QHE87694.1 YncE family protein [Hydrogenophaga sp. BPS33]
MSQANRFVLTKSATVLALALGLAACATSTFQAPDASFKGSVSVVETPLIVAGTEVKLAGRDFKPGQQVNLMIGGTSLSSTPATVGADGTFRTQFKVPATAEVGSHSLVVNATQPAAALVVPVKVSPNLPLSGQAAFELKSAKLPNGLYQAAYSAKSDRLFVTSASGRPPITQTTLIKVHPQTLAVEAQVKPVAAPAQPARPGAPAAAPRDPGLYAVYGVGVDDANGTVWVTNTRQNTVAVYNQADLKLIKQFEPGTAPHARDVYVDTRNGKAYVSTVSKDIAVFDTKTLTPLKNITIETSVVPARGQANNDRGFATMSLSLDAANSKLFTVSMATNEVAVIDTRTDKVEKVFVLEGAKSAIGVDYDPKSQRLLVAAQGSDNLLIVDANSGKVLHDVKVGAGALNVAFDPVKSLAYVNNRGADTITVVNLNGKIVANLPAGSFPNHATIDGKGGVYSVNKARGSDDPKGDHIAYIKPR